MALAVAGLVGAGPAEGTVEALTGGLDLDQETAGQVLDPSDPNVDPSRVFAVRKDTTTPAEATEQVEDAADVLNVESETEVTQNLGPDGEGTVIVVDTDPSEAADLIDAMVDSGLYTAVDYEGYAEPADVYTNTPNDPMFADAGSWGLKAAPGSRFNEVWAGLAQAPGAADSAPVAVIDTGFDLSHPDFGSNVVAGWNWVDNNANVSPCLYSSGAAEGHGTFTAGLVGATPNNATALVGAAWNTKVIVEKAAMYYPEYGTCRFPWSAITDAINGAVEHGAKVISMSLGATANGPTAVTNAMQDAIDQGIVVVAAAGNDGLASIHYPASYGPVISVASTNSSGGKSSFSNWTSAVDLSAPGEAVRGLAVGSGYTAPGNGTSYSTPLVASAAALLLRYNPWLTPAQVTSILTSTAQAQSTWKILNTKAAVDLARTTTPAAVVNASKTSVTLSGMGSEFTPSITPIAPTPVTVTTGLGNAWSVTSISPWLTVSPAVGESGAGFTVSAPVNYGSHRSGQLTVAAPGNRPVVIKVSQIPTLFLNDTMTVPGALGGPHIVDVRPSGVWGVTVSVSDRSWMFVAPWDSSAGWFSCLIAYQCNNEIGLPIGFAVVGHDSDDLAVMITANHGPERIGTITTNDVHSGDQVLTVIQEAGE
ncbi:MAG: S8 family serine peptidase [Bifidobacteriaceae bacterium]|jgi:hypothetical protein|nr:S8 family serine peptidase [Bifidobacteriaceae bacterium]